MAVTQNTILEIFVQETPSRISSGPSLVKSRRRVFPTDMFLQRVVGWVSTTAQRVLLYILSAGPVPRHVAFIMDGNRRYARAKHQKVEQGHFAGYIALRRVSLLQA